MRWARLALYSIAGLIGLLLIALLVVVNTDLGRFKHFGEDLVSELLERQFVIDGPLHASVGRKIEVDAENLRLAATEWSAEPDLVTVHSVRARVDTWSLISGPIRIESLEIDGVRIALQSQEDGADNWTLAVADEVPDDDPSRPSLPVLVDDAKITDIDLTFNSPGRPRPFIFRGQLSAGTSTVADHLQLNIDGAIHDTPVALEATAGPVLQLIDYGAVTFTVAASLGEIELNGNAALADLWQPARPSAMLTLSGPNAEYLTGILQLEPITTGPLDLRVSVGPVGDKMQIGLNGAFGEFAVDVSGHVDSLRSLQDLDLRLAASGPDARTVGALLGRPNVPQDPFNIVANVTRSGKHVSIEPVTIAIGESRFDINARFQNFPDPNAASLRLNIAGPDFGRFNALFGLPGKLTGPFKVDATIKPLSPSGAAVDLAAQAQDIQLTVNGSVTDAEDFVGTTLRLQVAGPDLRTVTAAGGLAAAPAEAFDLALQLDRIGEGLRLSDGSVSIGKDHATFSGVVGDKPLEAATDVSFALAGPNLAKSLVAFGVDADELPNARYAASGRIERGADGFLLHDLRAAIGERLDYELTVAGLITDDADFVGSQLDIKAHGTSLGALAAAGGVEGIAGLPFNTSAEVQRVANGFTVKNGRAKFGDDLLTLDGLIGAKPLERDTDIRFSVTAVDLKGTLAGLGIVVEALPPGKLVSSGAIRSRGNYFSLDNMSTNFAGAKIDLAGRVGGFPTLNGTDLELHVSGADFSRVLPPMDAIRALDKPFSLDTKIRLKGDLLTVADLRFKVDATSLSADFETAMNPPLARGRFSITADSPDVFRLAPEIAEVSVLESAPLTFRTGGDWSGDAWTFDELFLMLGKGTLTVKGSIDRPPDFDRTDLSFNMDIASLRNLSRLAGRDLPDDAAHLQFRLTGTREAMTLHDFAGTSGDSDIAGSFVLRDTGKTEFEAAFTSQRLNLAPYLLAPGDESEEPAPPGEKKTRVIPDTPLPMDALAKLEASVNVNFGEVVLRQRSLKNVLLEASLHDGALLVSKFNLANTLGGSLSGSFRLRPVDGGGDLLFDIQGTGLTMGLPAESPEDLAALPTFDLDTVLAGKGRTVRELAGSLGGYVRLTSGEGRIHSSAMRYLTSDFLSEVLTTVNPFTKTDPYNSVKCTAILLAANDGVISGKPAAVMQTVRIQIFANATIDLKTEKLDADIKTVPQKGLGMSFSDLINPYTRVSGTLASPSLMLDPKGVLIEGGAAVATAGISFLAKRFKDRYLTAKDQCGKAIEESNAEFMALREKYRPGTSK